MVREDSSCKNRPHGSAKLPRLVHGGHEGGGNPKRGIKEPVHKVNCVDPKAPRFPPYLTTLRSHSGALPRAKFFISIWDSSSSARVE
jgi:hypothetical protein